jgi:hypothetical protein
MRGAFDMMMGGIFGKKKHRYGDPETPVDFGNGWTPPIRGQQHQMPDGSMMDGQMQPEKQGGFFQRPGVSEGLGTFADTLIKLRSGVNPGIMDNLRHGQDRQFAEAQYQRKRTDDYADWERQQDYARENKAPYRWESNDGSLMEMGPNGTPVVVYKDPTSKPVMQIDPVTGVMRQVQVEQPVKDEEFGGWGDDNNETPPATSGVPKSNLGGNVLSRAQYEAMVQSLGPEGALNHIKKYNLRVGN